jgi:hypothetical protein
MNTGQDCMSSCHNHGFALGGTVYDSGGKPKSQVQLASSSPAASSSRCFQAATETSTTRDRTSILRVPISASATPTANRKCPLVPRRRELATPVTRAVALLASRRCSF